MHLPVRLQVHQAPVNDLLQRREIFYGGGEKDDVELLLAQPRATQVAMNKAQVGVVAEDPGSLLQLREVNIQPRYLCIGDLRHLMTQPAVAAAYLQHVQGTPLTLKVTHQAPGRTPSGLPFPVM